jgi:hypothetical protein
MMYHRAEAEAQSNHAWNPGNGKQPASEDGSTFQAGHPAQHHHWSRDRPPREQVPAAVAGR